MIATPKTFLGQRLGHDAIEAGMIELAQLAEEIRRRFAQIAGRAQPTRFDERLWKWRVAPKQRAVAFSFWHCDLRKDVVNDRQAAFADDNATAIVPALPLRLGSRMRTSANSASSSRVIGPARSTSIPPSRDRDHGRFDAVFGRAAVNNQRNASRQFLHHMAARRSG